MKQWLTLFFSWIYNSLKYRNKLPLISIWQNKVAFTTTTKKPDFNKQNRFSFHYAYMDSHSNMQKHVLLLQECCWWSTPFICSIQGMNCAENSLDSWTCPRSCNTTYRGQTERILNCTRGIIKLFSTENNVSLVSENFSTCTVFVWQREKHPHTSAHSHKWTQSVVYVWNSTLSY